MEKEDIKEIKKAFLISFMICLIAGILQYIFSIELNTFSNDKYPGIKGRINSTFYIATLLDKYIVLMFYLIQSMNKLHLYVAHNHDVLLLIIRNLRLFR